MSGEPLRIAISGPNASGKTTLAEAMAERYGLPVIEENVAEIDKSRSLLERLYAEQAPAEKIVEAKRNWIGTFIAWIKSREAAYATTPGFVADRWEADLLDLWLVFFGRERNIDNITAEMVRNLYAKGRIMDIAIMMPLAKPFTEDNNDVDVHRSGTFTNRLLNSMVTNGIIQTVPNLRVLRIPLEAHSLGDRMDLIDKAVRGLPS